MEKTTYFLTRVIILVFCFCSGIALAETGTIDVVNAKGATDVSVPILVYHRFDPKIPGSMTINTVKFENQLKWLKDNNYTVIPLKTLVNYLEGKGPAPAPKSVVITADDGHRSVYTYMLPLVKKYNIPVTLFIFPTVISHAPYALTWQQLKELQQTGLFDIQGHTYWHPNFKQEKRRLSASAYQNLVHVQLYKSKSILEQKLGIRVNFLAWPFGIYDDYLEKEAKNAGYTMAFSIDARRASKSEKSMKQPRYMVIQQLSNQYFAAIVAGPHKVNKNSKVKLAHKS